MSSLTNGQFRVHAILVALVMRVNSFDNLSVLILLRQFTHHCNNRKLTLLAKQSSLVASASTYLTTSFPRPPRTSALFAPVKRVLVILDRLSTALSPTLCFRVVTSRVAMYEGFL